LYNCQLVSIGQKQTILLAIQAVLFTLQTGFLFLAFRESRRASDIAREALVAGERAFVFATQLAQFWEHDPNSNEYNWRFRPTWQNSGNTPSKNMQIHTDYFLRDIPLPLNFRFDYSSTDVGLVLVPPKGSLNGGVAPAHPNPAVSPQDIIDIQSGHKFFYLWGWTTYSDVFPGTPRHITRFCWQIDAVGDPRAFVPGTSAPNPGSLAFSMFHHREGNCADDECDS
jgi:hypothetical protein